jgi:hypothetical protein
MGRNAQRRRAMKAADRAPEQITVPQPAPEPGGPPACGDWATCMGECDDGFGHGCTVCHLAGATFSDEWSDEAPPIFYRLVIWEGQRPETDEAGALECQEVQKRHLDEARSEPSAAIRRFLESLEDQSSDDRDPRLNPAPWPPMSLRASGPALLLRLYLPTPAHALLTSMIAADAERHGLACFDPQIGLLRPVSEDICAEVMRRNGISFE